MLITFLLTQTDPAFNPKFSPDDKMMRGIDFQADNMENIRQ